MASESVTPGPGPIATAPQPLSASVLPFGPVQVRRREPALSDAELVAIQKMLLEHAIVTSGCPLARKLLAGE